MVASLLPAVKRRRSLLSWAELMAMPSMAFTYRADQGVRQAGAAQFTAANKEYLQIAHASQTGLDLSTTDFSLSVWVKRSSTGLQFICGKYEDTSNAWYLRFESGDQIKFFAEETNNTRIELITSNTFTSTTTWYHIVVLADRDGAGKIYVNDTDESLGTSTMGAQNLDNTGAFEVGRAGVVDYLDAAVASLQISTGGRLYTAAEITWLYNSGNGRIWDAIENATGDGAAINDANLKAFYDLKEGAGEVRFDNSGNGNDLTPVGDELVTNGGFTAADNTLTWTFETNWSDDPANDEADASAANGAANELRQASVIGGAFTYTTIFTVQNYSAGSIQLKTSGADGTSRSANGTYTQDLSPNAASDITFSPSTFTGSITSVSVKVTSPVSRTTGIPGGDALDFNLATDFDGVNDYLSITAKNLLKADNSIAYASVGDWAANGVGATVNRVVLADDSITTTGLPSGVVTAYKCVVGDQALFAFVSPVQLSNAAHSTSVWVYPVTTTKQFRLSQANFSSNPNGSYVSCTAGQWTEVEQANWNPGVDALGQIHVEQEDATAQTVYITAFQVEQNAATTAWDANALFSPGDQDFWGSIWARSTGGASAEEWLFARSGEYRMRTDGSGNWRWTCFGKNVDIAMTEDTWEHLLFYYSKADDKIYLALNGGAFSETATLTPTQVATDALGIGGSAGNYHGGRLDASMFGTAAHGWVQGTTTPAALRDAMYNSGDGIKYDDLSTANKSDYGLVEAFDMETEYSGGPAFTGRHNAIALTNNGSITEGGVEGVGYSAGIVGLWEDDTGNGNHAEQTVEAKKFQYHRKPKDSSGNDVFGGNPGVYCDGTDDLMLVVTNAFLVGPTGLIFVLLHLDAVGDANRQILASADEATDTTLLAFYAHQNDAQGNKPAIWENAGGTATDIEATNSLTVDTTYILLFTSNGSVYGYRRDKVAEPLVLDAGPNNGDWFAASVGVADNVSVGALKRNSGEINHLSGWIAVLGGIDAKVANGREIRSLEARLTSYSNGGSL